MEGFLRHRIAGLLEVSVDEIPADIPFESLGIDSTAQVLILGDLEDYVGREVSPTLLLDVDTIAEVAAYVGQTTTAPMAKRPLDASAE